MKTLEVVPLRHLRTTTLVVGRHHLGKTTFIIWTPRHGGFLPRCRWQGTRRWLFGCEETVYKIT